MQDELSRKLDRPRKLRVEFFGEPETVPSSRDSGHVSSSPDAGGPKMVPTSVDGGHVSSFLDIGGKEGAQSRGCVGELVIHAIQRANEGSEHSPGDTWHAPNVGEFRTRR